MSQVSLISPIPVAPSFPPLSYRGTPVLTTEMLAQAYDVVPKQIRQNFANNRERFIEGKHFFLLSGNDLKEFKNCVENFDSVQFGKRTASVTLYTDRGCARHAKSLNTDRAWDMYELLEETFFAVVKTEQPVSRPVTLNDELISASERAELKLIVDAKLSTYPAAVQGKARAEIWAKHNRHFRIAEYSQLPARLMPEAREFLLSVRVRAINAIPTAESAIPYSALTTSSVYSDRIAALDRLEEEWIEFAGETRSRLHQFVNDLLRVKESTYPELLNRVCSRQNISTDPLLGILQSNSYNAQTWIDAGISEMRAAIRAAKTANRLMGEAN